MEHSVHIGKDGWLFLTGGNNKPIQYYDRPGVFNLQIVHAWDVLFGARCSYFQEKNIRYVHLFVPDKLTIYPEFFDGKLEYFSCHPINVFCGNSTLKKNVIYWDCLINPVGYFNKQKEKYRLFDKTDTHWNFLGCYSAYQLICSKLGYKQNIDLITREFQEVTMALDLGSKIDPPIKETVRFYSVIKDAKRVYANDIVLYKEKNKMENEIGLHVGSHVVFRNEKSPYKKKVILFGDSYSEYRSRKLTALLAETFYEVHFIWSVSIDYDYVGKIKPDIVITEIAERFMSQVPADNFNVVKYAESKLKNFQKSFIPN